MGKNIYIGVDNVARKVKQPIIGVDNIARNVKSGFIGVDNVARQFFSGGTPISNFAVGTSVYINENGVRQEYLIVNQGIPSGSSLYDSSCNGTWLLRKYIIESIKFAGTSGSQNAYEGSNAQTWLSTTMLSKFDTDVQNVIKEVKIPYNDKGQLGTVKTGANGFSCKLFLLSLFEAGLSSAPNNYVPVEGAKLDYFESGAIATSSPGRIAYLNGTATGWWLRTPYKLDAYMEGVITSEGSLSWTSGSGTRGIRPALIMPFETLVDSDMNIIAA